MGIHAYPTGSAEDFANCYDPAWGVLKDRTHPSPGNHEFETAGGSGYFGYFGASAHSGYYAFRRGEWRIYSLNSQAIDQDQLDWLTTDLAAHPTRCVLAYWHEPMFTSRLSGTSPDTKPLWDLLYAAGADVILNGHAHMYERFAPQTPDGVAAADGIREFVTGTGGRTPGEIGPAAPNSEVLHTGTWGALRVRLRPDGYDWEFRRAWGDSFRDSGSDNCH